MRAIGRAPSLPHRAWAILAVAVAACAPPSTPSTPSSPVATAPARAMPDATHPPPSSASTTQRRTIHGAPFAYETHGQGVPVVFIHGLPTDRRSLVPRFEPLFSTSTSGGWRRIYPDLPGVGDTPARPAITNLDGYVDEIAAFIEEETGGQRFALVGVSWGGYFAQAYARRHPDRVAGLALVVPSFGSRDGVRPPRSVIVSEPGVLDGEPPPVAGLLKAAATVHTRAVRDLLKRDVQPGGRSADGEFLDRVLGTRLTYHDEVRQLRFDGPALVVTGKQDAICGYADAWSFAERLPRATFALLDRGGHALAIEQGDLLRAHVGEWLARVREGLGQAYETPRP